MEVKMATMRDVFYSNERWNLTSERWHLFLEECGLCHTSLTRIEVKNKKKWLLAKIKYGIE